MAILLHDYSHTVAKDALLGASANGDREQHSLKTAVGRRKNLQGICVVTGACGKKTLHESVAGGA
jgi:hypothetical protein